MHGEIERSVQWTPIKKLSCNDRAYIQNIIADLENARVAGDVQRVLEYAREYERILILCGNTTDETVQSFKRALGMARDHLDLGTCKVIQRSLNPIQKPQRKTPRGFGHGFAGMLNEAFKLEDKPKKVERILSGFGDGFRGQLDQAHKAIQRQAEPIVIAEIPHPAIIDPLYGFPLICNKQCPHVQCSSWGTLEMEGKPCRNRVETNEQWGERSHVKSSQIERMFGGN